MKKANRMFVSAVIAASVFSSIPSAFAQEAFLDSESALTEPAVERNEEAAHPNPTNIDSSPSNMGATYAPFKDVQDTSYEEAVAFLYNNGFVNGLSATHFGVFQSLKRVDAAIIIGHYLGADKTNPSPGKAPFTDVPDRAVSTVASLYEAGVIQGKTATTFGPYGTITRGEAAIILSRLLPSNSAIPAIEFTDVAGRYKEAVAKLAAAGIVQGKTTTQFGTQDHLTRGQLALFIYRLHLYEQKGKNPEPAEDSTSGAESEGGFVAFGDSNTSGSYFAAQYPAYQSAKWTDQVAAVYSKGMTEDAYNAGQSGETTTRALKRFKKEVLDLNPRYVSIMFGLNDALLYKGEPQVTKEQFEKNLVSMITQLKAKNVKILLMTNLPVNEDIYYTFYSAQNLKAAYAPKGGLRQWENSYNDIIRKVAKTQQVQLIDNYANAIAKAGSETDAAIAKSGLVDDLLGFHWSPKGHSMIAYSVKHYLSK